MNGVTSSIAFVISGTFAVACFPGPLPPSDGDVANAGDADAATSDAVVDDTLEDTGDASSSDADSLTTTDTDADEGDAGECQDVGDCGHLAGVCTKLACLEHTCVASPDNGASCDDGVACTRDDTCSGFSCHGTAYTCDDAIACTVDTCDGEGGCDYPPAPGWCHIGAECVARGTLAPGDPCRVCDGGEAWSGNDGASCDDGDDMCSLEDTCDETQCMPGPAPEDDGSDWSIRPLVADDPTATRVNGIARAPVDPWILASAHGPAVLPTTTGDRPLSDDSVVLVQRESTGLLADVIFDGFDQARVEAFAPNLRHQLVGLIVSHQGVGTLTLSGAAPTNLSVDRAEILVLDGATHGARVRTHVDLDDLDAIGVQASGLSFVSGRFGVDFAPGVGPTFANSEPFEDIGVAALAANTGNVLWAAHLGSDEALGRTSLCALPTTNEFVISTAMHTNATIENSDGDSEPLFFLASYATPLFVWLDGADGDVALTSFPFSYVADPEADGAILAGPKLIDCDATGNLVYVDASAHDNAGSLELTPSKTGGTLVRVERDHSLSWTVAFEGATLTAATPNAASDGYWVAFITDGMAGTSSIRDATHTLTLDDDGTGIVDVSAAGEVGAARFVAKDALAPVASMIVGAGGTLVMGGTSLFTAPTFVGAGAPMTLPQSADESGFALGINNNHAWECAPPAP